MKLFRAHTSFIPNSISFSLSREKYVIVLPKTDYEVTEPSSNLDVYIRIPSNSEKDGFKKVYISPEEIKQFGEIQNDLSAKDVKDILDKISFAPSCIDFKWGWEITEVDGLGWDDLENLKSSARIRGFLINTTFQRPDTNTGIVGVGRGRRMWVEYNATEESVIMTAWVCMELIVKHELMEAIKVGGARILNPHKTLEELAYPEKIQK